MTDRGRQYTLDLASYITAHDESNELIVLTGTAKVHAETTLHLRLQVPVYSTPLINELRGGDLHLVKRQEIPVRPPSVLLSPGRTHRSPLQTKFPEIFSARQKDKLHYRYPGVGGESYMDVIERVRPIIIGQ
jgi:broad specificity phosphatase PhoE